VLPHPAGALPCRNDVGPGSRRPRL
jgi:hypothetical protein